MKSFNCVVKLRNASGVNLRAIFCKPTLFAMMLTLLAASPLCRAQVQVASISSAIELARADMRSQRTEIITATMQLSDKDAAAFWPIYRKYEYERSIVDDGRAAVVKEYAQKYSTITDPDAKSMTDRMLDYDSREIALKKKYVKEFSKIFPATTVAKFFQLDHRIDLLMAMQIESSLPPLWRQSDVAQQNADPQNTTSQNVEPQN
jgi:hypothetical protein